ncbi:MAG: phosphoglycerate kinase [Bacteroidetes bacterium]|nr:phosphoglycerate kinase [Bacteroidota bacterium]MCW5895212.1 phosphoglycerate kinase [Bacteroidota bacterium]
MMTKTIDDVDLKGKRVLVRVDFNVPMTDDLKISDDKRIVESLPTIRKILDSGGIPILMSHLGRPKGGPNPEFSLKPVANHLATLLSTNVQFVADCIGKETKKIVDGLKPGDILLLENLRFHPEEEKNNPDFAKELAGWGDVYVNDAFGTAHRAHASTEGVTKFLKPCVAGYLMKKEIEYLTQAVANPKRPYVAILGGAKISGKIDVIQNLLPKVDVLVIGGGMAFTFFRAQELEVGDSLVEQEKVQLAKEILEHIKEKNRRVILPIDCIIADKFDNNAQRKTVPITKIPSGWRGLDIGPETIKLIRLQMKGAKTIIWNGPMGVFEMPNFANGTLEIAKLLAEATTSGATTIVGGGDSAAAVVQMGFESSISHVSTGGGASLEFLEGKQLPGLAALDTKYV